MKRRMDSGMHKRDLMLRKHSKERVWFTVFCVHYFYFQGSYTVFIKTLDFRAHDQFIHKVIAVVSMEFKGFRAFANFVFVALSPSSILSQYFTLQLLV